MMATETRSLEDLLSSDLFDTRELQERIDYLAGVANDHEASEEHENTECIHCDEDTAAELSTAYLLAEELQHYAEDYQYGETVVADYYFVQFAQELAEDIGAIDPNASWPLSYIDWDAAADALKQDYSAIDFEGRRWWVR